MSDDADDDMSIPTQFCLIWLLTQKRETDANVTSKQVKERMKSYTLRL